ncbi:15397_t:CDS:1 [Funneliformis mosseae]|uniref:15397_t:CDS:1 n=1 Tax=Funneliformis mosseae TaxID=27381 RepID=A0A9N8YMZ4_FUNMO|nr:15397_t:CDS:1 [Funneliformis mosseae]
MNVGSIQKVVEIPLPTSNQTVEIDCDQLGTARETLNMFGNEVTDMKYWIHFALFYNVKRDSPEEAVSILERGLLSPGSSEDRCKCLNLLASIYFKMYKAPKYQADVDQKNHFLIQATEKFNEASQLNPHNQVSLVGKGLIYLAKKDPVQAHREFTNALRVSPNFIPALFGLARIQYSQKTFKDALATYQRIARLNPFMTHPDPRIGIGLCFNKLNRFDEAVQAFDRAVVMNPSSVPANILLATIEFDISKQLDPYEDIPDEERLANYCSAMERVELALDIDPTKSSALILMAHGYYLREEMDFALEALRRAEKYADSRFMQSETHYQLARAFHFMEDFDKAFYHYYHAIDINENHTSARYGYGQMLIHNGYYDEAKAEFEKLWHLNIKNMDVTTVLCVLNAHIGFNDSDQSVKQKALTDFDRISKAFVEDKYKNPDISTVKAWFFEQRKNPVKALASLKKAKELYERLHRPVPFELLNRMGNMAFKAKYHTEAIEHYSEALEIVRKLPSKGGYRGLAVYYNLGRAHEAAHNTEQARKIYKYIIDHGPEFVLARLRLAAIEEKLKHHGKVDEIIHEVLDLDEDNVEVKKIQALYQLRRGDYHSPRNLLHTLADKNDLVAMTALGSLYLIKGRQLKQEQEKSQREVYYKRSVELFQKALNLNSKNIWAANGITVALAETGRMQEANEGFWKILQNCPKPEFNINYAHTCALLGDYGNAIRFYEVASKKYQHRDHQIMEWIARVYYITGKERKNLESLETALDWTQRALRLKPDHKIALHNLALLQQTRAQLISERIKGGQSKAAPTASTTSTNTNSTTATSPNISLMELKKVMDWTQWSTKTFEEILKDEYKKLMFDRELVKHRVAFGKSIFQSFDKKKKELEIMEEQKEVERKEREKIDEEERLVEEQKAAEEAALEDERRKRAVEEDRIRNERLQEYAEKQRILYSREEKSKRRRYSSDEDEKNMSSRKARRGF